MCKKIKLNKLGKNNDIIDMRVAYGIFVQEE